MADNSDFYQQYDSIIPTICDGYARFLEAGAAAVPADVKSIYDIGIGTGSFSLAVRKRNSGVFVYGRDINSELVKVAQGRLPGSEITEGDAFENPLPKADYAISSLVTHHLSDADRREMLLRVARIGRGFVNFDLALFDGKNKDDLLKSALEFASLTFRDNNTLERIAEEIRENDNPMPLDLHREIFESAGFRFNVLEKKFPYAVYSVTN
jgi:hypothetical protein